MHQYLIWDETLLYHYITVTEVAATDRTFLLADPAFKELSKNTAQHQQVIFWVGGSWFTGYYMGMYGKKVAIQRAYGKRATKFNAASSLKNRNKFLLCKDEEVLEYHRPDTVSIVSAPQHTDTSRTLNDYTKFMLKDMVLHGHMFGDLALFTGWFNEKYLLPSRMERNDMFTIPYFKDVRDALQFLIKIRKEEPETVAQWESVAETKLEKRGRF
jgi:hypothetical protein